MEPALFNQDKTVNPGYRPDFSSYILPYTTWFQDDFLGGVRGMTAAEIGVYTVLLNEMYARGTALDMTEARMARSCGLPVSGFRKVLATLIAEGKILRLDAGLWNERVEKTLLARKNQHAINSKAGVQSGIKRNKINDRDERPFNDRSTTDEPISEAHKESSSSSPNARARHHAPAREADPPPRSDLVAIPDDGVALYEAVLAAVGLQNRAALTAYWMPPGAIVHCIRWRALGLYDSEIVEIARQSRKNHHDPPSGPKALDRAMTIAATYKTGPKQLARAGGQAHDRPSTRESTMRDVIAAAARGTT